MHLYFLMAALFLAMAALMAADAALTSFTLLPWFSGLRWLRVHFITLGAVTEALFGLLPVVVAIRAGLPRPRFRWDIWLTLNLGLLTLLVGIPIVNQALILAGGTLVFVAATLLLVQLQGMRRAAGPEAQPTSRGGSGRKFYVAGLSFFLVGIVVGTGLWLGWNEPLRIQTPIEVHIHANNWGLMSLVFAGLLLDMVPTWAKRSLAWPRSVTPIFWMLTLGALGLVLGPWVKSNLLSVLGILLYLAGTFWLLLNVVKPIWGDRAIWSQPGVWHLVTAYFWILVPALVAPLIIWGVPDFPGVGIEQNAPQVLIYCWVLQFSYAFLGFFFYRLFLPDQPAKLGGSWLSLVAVHLGGLFLWASILFVDYYGPLHGMAYVFWTISIIPIAWSLWRIMRQGLASLTDRTIALEAAG